MGVFDLVYNIDFELVALFITILILIETSFNYPKNTRKNKIFRFMSVLIIICEAFDILTAFTITYGDIVPIPLNIIANSIYFMSGLFLCYVFHFYIQFSVIPPEGKRFLIKTNAVILVIAEFCFILNAFFGFIFYFSPDGEYLHGIAYYGVHFLSVWFVTCASTTLFINCKLIKPSQIVSSVAFISLYFISVILQAFVFPDILIIMPAVSGMAIIAAFSLESPDYITLQTTLHELTITKRELEAANKKYFGLAYTDLMTDLENRAAYNIRLDSLNVSPEKSSVTILIADINNLKHLNDNYGHLIGDDAIVHAARLLKRNFSDSSCYTCYRIGGDEFAVISIGVSEEAFAECYRRFYEEMIIDRKQLQYPFYLSSGYCRVGDLTLLEALRNADAEMYAAKQNSKSVVL